MVVKIVLAAIVLVVSFNVGSPLKCYFCVNVLDSDCAKGNLSSMGIMDCPNINGMEAWCISVPDPENYQPPAMVRECINVAPPGHDPCQKFKDCKSCTSDLCNGN